MSVAAVIDRRAGALVDQRDLAEVVAGPKRRANLAGHADSRVPLDDHEEAGGARSFGRDRPRLRRSAVPSSVVQPLEVFVGKAGEDRDIAECFLGSRGACGPDHTREGPSAKAANFASMRTQAALYEEIDLELSWSEQELPERERTKHVHRLHPYLGKFVPQLAEVFLRGTRSPGDLVWDPFAGSGTTLVEANAFGARAAGCDVSAFNCMLMRVKTAAYDPAALLGDVVTLSAREKPAQAG